jgi:uncharacterized Zn finger protein
MKIEFQVESSDGITSYIVEFVREGNALFAHCNCPAGNYGKLCKHKLMIMSGEIENFHDVNQKQSYEIVKGWIQNSSLPGFMFDLASSEKELEKLKVRVNRFKKQLEIALKDGVLIT